MRKKHIIRAVIVLIILVFIWVSYNTRWIWRDYLSSPPVNFIENADISLDIYPEGHRSASVFTNSGFSADISPEAIETLRIRLMNLGITGTFFVAPFKTGPGELTKDHTQFRELEILQYFGFEIAQDGGEMNRALGEGEEESIKWGREILIGLGLRVSGYRSPLSSSTCNIEKLLDREGYLYNYLSSAPPITFRTVLFPGFRGSVNFPFHPEGMKLLAVVSQAEPAIEPETASKQFDDIHRRGGVFIFRTELPRVRDDKNLAVLEEFLRYIKGKDTWLCTLGEVCRWWLAREQVEVATFREGDIINIIYDNQTPIEMKNTRIRFKNISNLPKMYRVVDRTGEVSAEGFIPESGWINVTLFPSNRE